MAVDLFPRPGRERNMRVLPSEFRAQVEAILQKMELFDASEHLVWSNEAATVWFGGWQSASAPANSGSPGRATIWIQGWWRLSNSFQPRQRNCGTTKRRGRRKRGEMPQFPSNLVQH